MNLIDAMTLKFPKIISMVGAGGKTSFIFTLAKEAAGLGKSVLITTTTAMFNPEHFQTGPTTPAQAFDHLFIGPARDLPAPEPGTILVAAPALISQDSKLTGYTPQDLSILLTPPRFDLVLIEADGARMRPVKAPADHEPVLPGRTDMVVGCIGLDGLDSPLDAPHVHRPEILATLSGQQMGDPVTAGTLILLAASHQGIFKSATPDMDRILLLNKADTPQLTEQGKSLGRNIIALDLADLCLVTCFLKMEDPVCHRLAPTPS